MSGPSWRPSPRRVYEARDPEVTSRMMSAVKSQANKSEIALRSALHRLGFRFRLQDKKLIGRPDLVLRKYKAAIFVDGDFWHGRALIEGGDAALRQVIRGPRYDWWRAKLARNIDRDQIVTAALQADGWVVIRVWESDLISEFDRTLELIVGRLKRRRPR